MSRVSIVELSPPGSSETLEGHVPTAREAERLESEITTLATWCEVKQQQREPLAPCTDEDRGDDDLEGDSRDGCTDRHNTLSDDSNGARSLKSFLDRLAELLCYKKDPTLITSTAIVHNDEEATIVAARNSYSHVPTWSDKDTKILECFAQVLEISSSDPDKLDSAMISKLYRTSVEYYDPRIRHHVKSMVSVENGTTGIEFFRGDGCCGRFISGEIDAFAFAKMVDRVSHHDRFNTKLEASLVPNKLRRVREELEFIKRPASSLDVAVKVAREYSGFRHTRVLLIKSLPARKVKAWKSLDEPTLGFAGIDIAQRLRKKFDDRVRRPKNIHAEMVLMAYLLGSGRSTPGTSFPYLGVSKKTCLLCGHILREMGRFESRGNHGKCYSQWTLPPALWSRLGTDDRLRTAASRLGSALREEGLKIEAPRRDAEKESVMAAQLPPRYEHSETLYNIASGSPGNAEREAEWLARIRRRHREEVSGHSLSTTQGSDEAASTVENTEDAGGECRKIESGGPTACAFCKETYKLTYTCQKCEAATYCDIDCYQSDRHRHKFRCSLGRPIDATDYLILSCHDVEFPQENEVLQQYGFECFASAHDKQRLFDIYQGLVVHSVVDEDDLRRAMEQDRLKELLVSRCRGTGMVHDVRWLENEEGFRANGQGQGVDYLLRRAVWELLSPDDRAVPFMHVQPREKRRAVLFYSQIRNGYKPGADEDNWISLGFCTAADDASEQLLARAYALLVSRCTFDEFWKAMAESRMVQLFEKYGLADPILHMRHFRGLMAVVRRWYQSVWELKRFVYTDAAHPFRAVQVDYGFMNCEDARQRMQLRRLYRTYFDQGQDEISLHEACVAGNLAPFLESALGRRLAVDPMLLFNYYPLDDGYPLMGMVADDVTVCPESSLDHVRAMLEAEGKGVVMITVPDSADESMQSSLRDRAAFLGRDVRRRNFSTPDGQRGTWFTCS
ncbi:hypothetical protein GMORB2_6643 [Geosmithia morbida]|uniref:MYND-type domain-containing protein n=1 Tax=Geosmithia morbida TaxID=1094350 RepID=A0A9P5D4T6_9HYPO|nr:uncharacterized protein GMORB2_6643 [Geosmithia morbida]KAF4123095.1 hypothetical protein GMORB2_6643 [Geosmithia morbida]